MDMTSGFFEELELLLEELSATGEGLENLGNSLEQIIQSLYIFKYLAELGLSGAVFLIGIIATILAAFVLGIIALLEYVFETLPVYRLARKAGRKSAILAWCPIFHEYFLAYVICDIPGDQPVRFITDKLSLKKRIHSYGIYILIFLGGNAIITSLISFLGIVPVIGQTLAPLATALYILPAAICTLFEYIYLKDILDIFKEDKKSNIITAIIITLLDALVTFGYARTIYLYTLWNKSPLPTEPADHL